MPDEIELPGGKTARRVPPQPGDLCLVCNQPLHAGDLVFETRGQRIPIHLAELARDLRAQLQGLLAQLEPRGAFLEASGERPALSRFWFFFGLYVLIGLVFAAVCAHRALHAGQRPVFWFGVGLVFNAFGYLVLLTRGSREVTAPAGVPAGLRKISATHRPQPCPGCGSLNHPSASRCADCGGELHPKIASEVARVRPGPR